MPCVCQVCACLHSNTDDKLDLFGLYSFHWQHNSFVLSSWTSHSWNCSAFTAQCLKAGVRAGLLSIKAVLIHTDSQDKGSRLPLSQSSQFSRASQKVFTEGVDLDADDVGNFIWPSVIAFKWISLYYVLIVWYLTVVIRLHNLPSSSWKTKYEMDISQYQ